LAISSWTGSSSASTYSSAHCLNCAMAGAWLSKCPQPSSPSSCPRSFVVLATRGTWP
jgi:hypothetical protein